jgi:multiple sugar transport system ATP-binding protein
LAEIRLERVSRIFGSGHAGVRDIELTIRDGELVVLVGPSGSGKSTLLRLIAGLDEPTGGRILIGGRDVTHVPPQERDLAMVFQSYALYPHKTVRDNLAFGLRMRGRPQPEIEGRVAAIARTLQIEGLLDRLPAQLSGGQRQRVALGRAMVREPQAFLLDEPLSNLDPGLRLDTRTELAQLHRRLGVTMIYVTHDQEEAMKLGERVVLLRDGRIEQAAPPMEIYRRPATLFAATFLGSPPMNLLAAQVDSAGEVRIDGLELRLTLPPGPAWSPGARVMIGIRPEDVRLKGDEPADLTCEVLVVEPTGSQLHVHLTAAPHRLVAVLPADREIAPGDRVPVSFRRDRLHVFADRGAVG